MFSTIIIIIIEWRFSYKKLSEENMCMKYEYDLVSMSDFAAVITFLRLKINNDSNAAIIINILE